MKKLICILLLFLCFSGNSQTLEVTYSLSIDMSGVQLTPFNHQYILYNSNGLSLQKKFLTKSNNEKRIDKNGASTSMVKVGNDTTYVFKNFLNNQMFSEERIFTKTLAVLDDLNIFDWKIEKDTLTILNYKCQKATTKFRGREYAVYFSTDIPISDGPWKFNGLPGLILKVDLINSISIFSIQAFKLRLNNEKVTILNPLNSKNAISFKAYKEEYNRKYYEMQTFTAEQNTGVVVNRGGLEILFDE